MQKYTHEDLFAVKTIVQTKIMKHHVTAVTLYCCDAIFDQLCHILDTDILLLAIVSKIVMCSREL